MFLAIQICLDQKAFIKPEVLAVVLQQLIDISPMPSLLMRTVSGVFYVFLTGVKVIQTVQRFPQLMNFILSLLTRLIVKQVWNDKVLWQGFVKCCQVMF